jgi:excisionase family DNA binding protein
MQRIVVIGTSGAGKTTLAREIARRKGVPHVEIDAFQWQPNWTAATRDELRAAMAAAVAPNAWVVDGNYLNVRDVVWPRADTIVWLDYSFLVVFGRVLRRTMHRVLFRDELWNGNYEKWSFLFTRDSILWWVITTHGRRRREIPEALAQSEFSHLRVVRFRSPRQANEWLKGISDEGTMSLKDELKEYYTVEELAALLRVTDSAIEKLAHGGEIAHDIVDAAMRIPRREVEKLLTQRRRVKMRRAGLAGLGLLAAIAGGVAAMKMRNRDGDNE